MPDNWSDFTVYPVEIPLAHVLKGESQKMKLGLILRCLWFSGSYPFAWKRSSAHYSPHFKINPWLLYLLQE